MQNMSCPYCKGLFGVSADMVGRNLLCPHCKKTVQIPPLTPANPPGQASFPTSFPPPNQSPPQTGSPHPETLTSEATGDSSPFDFSDSPYPTILFRFPWKNPPPEIQAQTKPLGEGLATYSLGKPYETAATGKASKLLWLGAGFLIFSVVILLGLLIGVVDEKKTRLINSALAALFLGPAILGFGWVVRKAVSGPNYPPLKLWICRDGFLWKTKKKFGAWHWLDLDNCVVSRLGISERVRDSFDFEYRFCGKDDNVIKFTTRSDPRNCQEMAEYLMRQAARAALPREQQRFATGKPCQFGTAQVDNQCLSIGRDDIPWKQISHVHFREGDLMDYFHGQGKPKVYSGLGIDHPYLLLELCRTLIVPASPPVSQAEDPLQFGGQQLQPQYPAQAEEENPFKFD